MKAEISSKTIKRSKFRDSRITLYAWIIILFVSPIIDVVFLELQGGMPKYIMYIKCSVLVVLLILSIANNKLAPLRKYLLVLLLILLGSQLRTLIEGISLWTKMFRGGEDFISINLSWQLIRLFQALLMIGMLFLLKEKPKDLYLVKGNPNAMAQPEKSIMGLLLNKKAISWKRLGFEFSFLLCGGLLLFLLLAGGLPSVNQLKSILPYVPFIILFSVMNAFSEEVLVRSSIFSALSDVVKPRQVLLITSLYFGILHYTGLPYGISGVLLSGFLGFVIGKSMLETKGFVWAWWIHFLVDIFNFSFLAMGTVVIGG